MSLPTNSILSNTATENPPQTSAPVTNSTETSPSASAAEEPQIMELNSKNLRKLDKYLREADLIMLPSKSTPPSTPVEVELEPEQEVEAAVTGEKTKNTQRGLAYNVFGMNPDHTEDEQVRVESELGRVFDKFNKTVSLMSAESNQTKCSSEQIRSAICHASPKLIEPVELSERVSYSNMLIARAMDLAKLAIDGMALANQAMTAAVPNDAFFDEQLAIQLESFRKLTENGTAQVTDVLKVHGQKAVPDTPRVNPLEANVKLFANQKLYKCRNCSYYGLSKKALWNHNKQHIPFDKQLTCQKCNFVTQYAHHLEYHILHSHRSKFFKCSECTFNTEFKSTLDSHVKFHHTGPFAFQCMDCDFQSKYCHRLKMHLSKHGHQKAPELVTDDDETFEAYMDNLSNDLKRLVR